MRQHLHAVRRGPVKNTQAKATVMTAAWERYEDAGREVMRLLAKDIGVEEVVDKKQEFQGTACPWEIEVAGYKSDGTLVVFECRKRGRNVEKGEMGSFAYVIEDLEAEGYVVCQKKFSKGAKKIADHHKIEHINLQFDQETGQKVIEFLGRCFVTRGMTMYMSGGPPKAETDESEE